MQGKECGVEEQAQTDRDDQCPSTIRSHVNLKELGLVHEQGTDEQDCQLIDHLKSIERGSLVGVHRCDETEDTQSAVVDKETLNGMTASSERDDQG